jgi:hypothetical protein
VKSSLVVLALLAACATSTVAASGGNITFCNGSQLAGTFAAVRGSAGAGNISYALQLKNISTSTCSVTGLPQGQLLGRHGGKLPTHVRAAFPGALSAVLVTLRHGQSTKATARFSPDVPGTGEPMMTGQCEPTAYSFRVTMHSGTTTVKLLPATPVCEHGQLQFSAYGR